MCANAIRAAMRVEPERVGDANLGMHGPPGGLGSASEEPPLTAEVTADAKADGSIIPRESSPDCGQ